MNVDRRVFLASLGATGIGGLKAMTSEEKADALEHYMIEELDGDASALQDRGQEGERRQPRGTGGVFRARSEPLPPLPEKPTILDFWNLRFRSNHGLQSAHHALKTGQPETVQLACLLHDSVQNLMKPDHGDWGGQLYEPYVPKEISWGIKYHAPLRFYADEENGYEYPEMYNRIWGEDYVPTETTRKKYEYARNHSMYMHARLITVNDNYAFERGVNPSLDPFIPLMEKYFKNPPEGLGNDDSPSSHMWRTIANPHRPL